MSRYVSSAIALLTGAAVMSIAWSAVAHRLAWTYVELSMACMRVSDAIRAHPDAVIALVAGGLIALASLGVSSGVLQLIRTTRLTAVLLRHRVASLPRRMELLTAAVGLRGLVDVVEAPEAFAFCYGLWRPRLMLSTALINALADDELEAVLRHEAAHVDAWDPLRIVVARSLSVALAFVPLTPGVLQAYLCRRELDADRASVNAMSDARPLAAALHRMLGVEQRRDLGSFAVGALSATDLRIDRLLGEDTSPRALLADVNRLHVIVFSIVLAATLCVLISSAHAATGVRPCLPC